MPIQGLLFARGFVGFASITALYHSLKYLDLSDVSALQFLLPTISGFSGMLFLKEPYLPIERYSSIISLLGVILIARPPFIFGHEGAQINVDLGAIGIRTLAVCAVIVSVFGASLAYVTTRAIGKRAHPMHVILAFSWCSVIFGTLMMKIQGEEFVLPKSSKWTALLIAVGTFGFLGQILLT